MDYYQLLKISSTASKKEIESAYQRLIKESEYDSTIDRIMVNTAYRILSNPKQKAAYDSIKEKRELGAAAYAATIKRRKPSIIWDQKKLLALTTILLVVCAVYYGFRFGHVLKSFSVGDAVFMSETHEKVGTILKIEEHNFGKHREEGYLIQAPDGTRWISAGEVKQRCYRQSP
jgi:curved DNA-binding protein CbpA